MRKGSYLLSAALALMLAGVAFSACGETGEENEAVTPHEHVYEWVVTKEATCLEEGEERQECTVCHETGETRQTDKTDHSPEPIPEVKATCTSKGKTAGVKCSVCNTVLQEQTETDMLPHTSDGIWHVDETQGTHYHECTVCTSRMDEAVHEEEQLPEVKATCTQKGKTAGVKCSVCDTILQEQTETEMLAHTPEPIPEVKATCTSKGKTEGSKCSICNTVLQEQTETEMLPHTSDETWHVDEAQGTHYHACTVCTSRMDETAHSAGGNWVQGKDTHYQTCTVCAAHLNETAHKAGAEWLQGEGTHYHVCETCSVKMDEAAHAEQQLPAVEATCTSKGKTAGVKCSICDIILTAQTDTDMIAHTSDEIWHVDETQGTHYHTCTVCTSRMDEAPHVEHILPYEGATCTQKGKTEGKDCSVCGTILKAQKEMETIPHQPDGEWHEDKETNSHYHICAMCEQQIDVGEHASAYPAAEDGTLYHAKICDTCGLKFDRELCYGQKIPTANEKMHYYDCEVCGQHYEQSHSYKYEPNPGDETTHTVKCVCGVSKANEKHLPKTKNWSTRYDGVFTTTTHSFTCKCGQVVEGEHIFVNNSSDGTRTCYTCGIGFFHFSKDSSGAFYVAQISLDDKYLDGLEKGGTLEIPYNFAENRRVLYFRGPMINNVDRFSKIVSTGVTRIMDGALSYNGSLETIVFQKLETMEPLGAQSTKLKNLKTIVLGPNMQTIHNSALQYNLPADAVFYYNGSADDWAKRPEALRTSLQNYTVYCYSKDAAAGTWHWENDTAKDTPVLWENAFVTLTRNVALLPGKEW